SDVCSSDLQLMVIHDPTLTGGMGGDLALDAGGALESGIMDDHELMVTGQVQVQLHPPDAGLQRLAETGQGVFRGLPAGASMAVYQHGFSQLDWRRCCRTLCTTLSRSK